MPLPLKKTENAALLNSINNTISKNHIDNIEEDITHLSISKLRNKKLNQEEKLNKGYKKIGFFLEPSLHLSLRKKLIEKNQNYEDFFKELLEDYLKNEK
ncbi:TPA: hypothetical protein ACPOT5_001753 [Haemophilus influenzae]